MMKFCGAPRLLIQVETEMGHSLSRRLLNLSARREEEEQEQERGCQEVKKKEQEKGVRVMHAKW